MRGARCGTSARLIVSRGEGGGAGGGEGGEREGEREGKLTL